MSITGVGNSSLSNQVNFKSGFASQKPPIPPFAETCSDNKKSKTAKYAAGAVGLAALVVAGIALKGKICKPNVVERTLSNGKKVVKTVTKNPNGGETVKMEVLNPDGTLACTKTKNITKTVDENGTRITKNCHYDGNGMDVIVKTDGICQGVGETADTTVVRHYDKEKNLLDKYVDICGKGDRMRYFQFFEPKNREFVTNTAVRGGHNGEIDHYAFADTIDRKCVAG